MAGKPSLKVVPDQTRTADAPAIEIRDLSLIFATADAPVIALSNIDLSIQKGEFVSFIGPSGCGKTTLMRVIADLEHQTEGEITVNGTSPQEARLARAYGYVFQAPALFAWRNVLRNVTLPLEIMGMARDEGLRRAARPDHGGHRQRSSGQAYPRYPRDAGVPQRRPSRARGLAGRPFL